MKYFIPPDIYNDVCNLIKKKLDAGVFEPSNSSYHSCWFCVCKKEERTPHGSIAGAAQ